MNRSILSIKIKQYREQKAITQQELAELLDVSDKSISKWELLDVSLEVLWIEEKEEENRFKKSFKYGFISYCIIFAFIILLKGWKEQDLYQDILSRGLSEIVKLVVVTFGQNSAIAFVPSLIIGFVFYFYIIPSQKVD